MFCNLTKWITLKICQFCLVLINSILSNLLCVWIFFHNNWVQQRKTLDYGCQQLWTKQSHMCTHAQITQRHSRNSRRTYYIWWYEYHVHTVTKKIPKKNHQYHTSEALCVKSERQVTKIWNQFPLIISFQICPWGKQGTIQLLNATNIKTGEEEAKVKRGGKVEEEKDEEEEEEEKEELLRRRWGGAGGGRRRNSVELKTVSMHLEKPIIMCSTLTLRNVPTTVFETVPLFREGRGWRKKKEFSWVQDIIYTPRKAHNYVLHPDSEKFSLHHLWNSSTVHLKKTKEQGGEGVEEEEGIQLSSVRDSICALGKAHNYALHTISQTCPRHCLCDSSTVYLKKRKEQGGQEVGKGKLEDKNRQKEGGKPWKPGGRRRWRQWKTVSLQ